MGSGGGYGPPRPYHPASPVMLMRDGPVPMGGHDLWAPNSEGTPDPIKETLLSLRLPLALSEIPLINSHPDIHLRAFFYAMDRS